MNLFLVALLGGCSGLRAFLPVAALCWFAWRSAIHFSGWRSFTASLIAVVITTLLALFELAGDKRPTAPARTSPPAFLARLVLAGFAGLVLAQPLLLSPVAAVAVGALGAGIGTYAGWFVRTRSVAELKCPDWPVAVTEDLVCIALSITFLHLMAVHSSLFLGNEGIWMNR